MVSTLNNRIGVIGIVISDRENTANHVNSVIGRYEHVVVGRMGIPYRQRGIAVISLIVDGNTDDIGALSGRLGSIPHVTVKTALAK